MPKHPVPKKKTAKRVSKQRYASHQAKALTNLSNVVSLTDCENCGLKRLTHHACQECGMYRGRQVIDKSAKEEKITKIKV